MDAPRVTQAPLMRAQRVPLMAKRALMADQARAAFAERAPNLAGSPLAAHLAAAAPAPAPAPAPKPVVATPAPVMTSGVVPAGTNVQQGISQTMAPTRNAMEQEMFTHPANRGSNR